MRNLTYTPNVPYPQRQLSLCVDMNGRLCAASAIYSIPGNAADGAGSFFDWLTTSDAGHTFKATPVSSGALFNLVQGNNTAVLDGGDPCLAYVSPLSNVPFVITPATTRATASGSGEDAANWARADFPRRFGGGNQSASVPLHTSANPYFPLATVPHFDPGKVTFAGLVPVFSTYNFGSYLVGVTFALAQSYDNFRSLRNGLSLNVMGLTRILKNGGAGQPLNPDFPGKILPLMTPAEEGEPGAGPGLAPRLRVLSTANYNEPSAFDPAWNCAALCYGDSADMLYALGFYKVVHPDTGNLFLMPYLVKSRDSGVSWISFDPDAPDLPGSSTAPYLSIVQPFYYQQPGFVWTGYDLQPDGSYAATPHPPIVFPVADKNGLPLCLPALATQTNTNGSVTLSQIVNEANHAQLVFAQGVLYFAYRNTLITQRAPAYGDMQGDPGTSHSLDIHGQMVSTPLRMSPSDPPIPQSAYTWAFGCSSDLGRTWEGLTSPPPMQYGALAASQDGHRLHWGLHTISDDGGHTWKPA